MPTSPARAAVAPTVTFRDVRSDDGTTLRAWTNRPGEDGTPTVLLCNALGTGPFHWPSFLRPGCDVRVVSWFHRGVGGSQRPRDPAHVRAEHFVEDALSVMDHFELARPVVVGWSTGVATATDLAHRHPERIAGLLGVGGVPGDTFATMLAPLLVPRPAARLVTSSWARALRLGGPLVSPLTTRLPFGARSLDLLSRAGLVGRVPDPDLAALAFAQVLAVPVQWYAHLALSTTRRTPPPLSRVTVPATFVGGSHDLVAGARDVASAARRMPHAQYVELRSSHFLPLEHPDRVHQLLRSLIARTR